MREGYSTGLPVSGGESPSATAVVGVTATGVLRALEVDATAAGEVASVVCGSGGGSGDGSGSVNPVEAGSCTGNGRR